MNSKTLYWSLLLLMIFFSPLLSMAQSPKTNYDALWKKVDSLVNKRGLTASALTEVNKIYALAKKENQQPQVIKALIYQASLEQNLTDEGEEKQFQAIEKELTQTTAPVSKALLNNILAEQYYRYFQNNRYRFYTRSKTVDFKKDDPATWTLDDLQTKITALYLASLKDEKLLQQTKLDAFGPVIIKGNMRHLRPTLYDFLANRALEYFTSGERYVTKPAYSFEIKAAAIFDPAADFIHYKIKTKDTVSLHYQALLIYQKLIAFHIDDPKPDALIDVDLSRLQFARGAAAGVEADHYYFLSVNHIAHQYESTPAAAQAWYLVAQWYVDKGGRYDPVNDTANRYAYTTAMEVCNKVLQQKDSSEGKYNCQALKQEIERKQINLATEKVNIPNAPFRTLVTYKNFTHLNFRVVVLTPNLTAQLENRYDDSYWRQLSSLKPIASWSQELPDTKDYQSHNVEVKINALPMGSYLLLASVDDKFSWNKNPMAVQYFYVSNISYVNNEQEYFVLNRETGEPLVHAEVNVWKNYYNSDKGAYTDKKISTLYTDSRGYVKLAYDTLVNNRAQKLEVSYKSDHLFFSEPEYVYYNNNVEPASSKDEYEKEQARVFLFSDRSIYRPGQTVYFKGIAVTKDRESKRNKIYANQKTKIFLKNANGEEIDSLVLTSNEYGSYSGKFKLPSSGLNGSFRLQDNNLNGTLSFSVEEYKRPTFDVSYEKLTAAYKVNDSIIITGNAKAYAGNNIDGAQVKYRVTRVAKFIYPWLYKGVGRPSVAPMEITNGTLTTGADGKFVIRFKAIPDEQVNKKMDPVFDYEVSADVTDINGETRSGATKVTVSYKSLQLQIALSQNASTDSLKTILVSAKNLNGEQTPALVQLKVFKLEQSNRLIRKRYWSQPDQFVMTYDEYIKDFPNDEYKDESNKENWKRGEQVAEAADSANKAIAINHTALAAGWYLVEAYTKDKYGDSVRDVKYVLLSDDKNKQLPVKEYLTTTADRQSLEPNEKASITIGTAANDVTIIQQKQSRDANEKISAAYSLINLNNEIKTIDVAAAESDRGGIGLNYFFVKNNRFYSSSENIAVPWTNKELQVSYKTWRDKTQPGSEEKWKVKIAGNKKEKVAAEMLASMYDASLDQFQRHAWIVPGVWPSNYFSSNWRSNVCFTSVQSQERYWNDENIVPLDKRYDVVIGINKGIQYMLQGRVAGVAVTAVQDMAPMGDDVAFKKVSLPMIQIRGNTSVNGNSTPLYVVDGEIVSAIDNLNTADVESMSVLKGAEATAQYGAQAANGVIVIITKAGAAKKQNPDVQIRKNFNETAFFLPDLQTDTAGNISFGFTIPEALTKWKFQALAHTKDLAFGYSTVNVVTQKELMIQPNAPRFLREGDKIELSAKLVNMSDKELTGTVQLELLNAATMQSVDGWFQNIQPLQYFTVAAGASEPMKFNITIPYSYNSAVVYRFKAVSGANGDGEEMALPVLTNSMLVTESMPINMRNTNAKSFTFDKLLKSGNSETLQQRALTVEYTSNPAWYAVQALPFLTDFPYECAEQTFNRYYANALAGMIANKAPKLKATIDKWNITDTTALMSNLQKNEELKSVLLEETPWVLAAKTEAQQKKNIAFLFDMVRMNDGLQNTYDKLKQLQSSNGGFVWFKGGPDDRYITQYIATGIGHLQKLGALQNAKQSWSEIAKKAVAYLDQRIADDYKDLIKQKADLKKNNLSYIAVQYLYMRSFFSDIAIPGSALNAITYYRKQAQQYWLQQNTYSKGMLALALNRTGDKATAASIIKSLQENAVVNEETGMYWKDVKAGYFWYEAPIETQAVMIEAFAEVKADTKVTNDLKTWLLKNKQTNNWKTTKATADACYALLLQGSDWLSETPVVEIKLGDKTISSNDSKTEAGTGYFKTTIDGTQVQPAMGNITVKVSGNSTGSTSWGSVYWQYFERLENITPATTPLQLTKKLFIEKNTDRGPVLTPVNENDVMKVGDKIKVRIELRADRDMEYVHMKDMRASCMEPVNVLSGYKWQDGLGYYESTKDASTNFFFSYVRKGVYVFEYPLFVTHEGNFSNGITTIQCMYAPEFSSHSEGVRVNVE